jgi:hypothetical protein
MPRIQCECKRVLSYRPGLAGKVVKCPGCSAKIRLPDAEPAASPAHAASDEGQELQLERNEADTLLAASARTSEGTAPSGPSLPQSEPLVWPQARRADATASDPAAAEDYWSALPGAFRFPLAGEGLYALIVGVILLTVAYYLVFAVAGFPLLGILLAIAVTVVTVGYMSGYLMTIIERTAHGEKDAPGWPDLTDWEENALKPFFFFLALFALCVGPSIAYQRLAQEPGDGVRYAILAAGVFYMPMGMLCVALANDFAGLSPIRVVRAILSVPGRYVVAWALVTVSIGAEILGRTYIAQWHIPIVGAILQQTVGCYFLFVAARILGLLYCKSRPQLDWLAG